MSSTGRSDARVPHDVYPTPHWCVDRLMDAIGHQLPGGLWLEPAVGDGAIIQAVEAWWRANRPWDPLPQWEGIDIRPTPAASIVADFVTMEPSELPERARVVITNPPYRLAEEFFRQAGCQSGIVILLLRVGFLESEARNEFLRLMTPSVYVLPNRPSFAGKGVDSTAYAWMVWGLDEQPRVEILRTTPQEVRRAAKAAARKANRAASYALGAESQSATGDA